MFEIRPYKIFSIFFVLTRLKCIIFLPETKFKHLNLHVLLLAFAKNVTFYIGYIHNQYKKCHIYIG